jgi:hypothetical protein
LPTYVAGPSRAAGSRPRGCQGAPDCQDLIHLFISCLFVSSLSSVDICVIDSVGSKQYDNELETSGKHFCELKILKCIGQDRMQSPWEPARTRKIQSHQLNPICCWDPKNPESVFSSDSKYSNNENNRKFHKVINLVWWGYSHINNPSYHISWIIHHLPLYIYYPSYHMYHISHYITLYHIISHYITLYHIISYIILIIPVITVL